MSNPTAAQHREMLDLVRGTHAHIDTLIVAGMEERVIVAAMMTALVERSLRSSDDVIVTTNWLQSYADMLLQLGPAMLATIREQHG